MPPDQILRSTTLDNISPNALRGLLNSGGSVEKTWRWGFVGLCEIRGNVLKYRFGIESGEIPISSINSVTQKRTLLVHSVLIHHSGGSVIELTPDRSGMAEDIARTLQGLIGGTAT